MPRNLIANALRRVHDTALTNTTIEVFEPRVSYAPGDGFDVSYPDTPSASYDARIDGQNRTGTKERGGTTTDLDAVIRVRDDLFVLAPHNDSLTIPANKTVTIPENAARTIGTITIQSGGELIVNGRLKTTEVDNDGTLTNNGIVTVDGTRPLTRGYGGETDAEARIVDTATRTEYAVESVSEPEGGLTVLRVTER